MDTRNPVTENEVIKNTNVIKYDEFFAGQEDNEYVMNNLNKQAYVQLIALRQRLAAMERTYSWSMTAHLRAYAANHPTTARRLIRFCRFLSRASASVLRSRTPGIIPGPKEPFYADKMRLEHSEPSISPNFAIETSPHPLVSIVVPTYGQDDFTTRCLFSIAMCQPRLSFEVIVVDDAYPRAEPWLLKAGIRGVRFIRNATNLGYLKTCNSAARLAEGKYLMFLNNDTEVLPGAVEALTDLLEADPTIGMAGSKLIYPDGALQEAGGIVWSDGSAWNWGRNMDPDRPEFNYRRDVDYISGASILLAKTTFDSLGGFDEIFAPAYYEDTDLAFRLRERNLRVVYEPRSVVLHHEGRSHGVDESTGAKAYQVRNARIMEERWRSVLARDSYETGKCVLRARDRAKNKKVILVIDHYVPEPDRDAGSRSTLGILECLVSAGWVVKFWPENKVFSQEYTPVLEDLGIEVLDSRLAWSYDKWLKRNGEALDCVLLMRPATSARLLASTKKNTRASLCYYGHDLHHVRMAQEARLRDDARLARKASKMQTVERALWRQCDVVIYPSDEETAAVKTLEPGVNAKTIVGFWARRFADRPAPPTGAHIVFVAGFAHSPNVDAAKFLVNEVLPIVHRDRPDAVAILAGSQPTEDVQALQNARVVVTGWLSADDLGKIYATSRVGVVPLRFGAGVKGKVVEALAEGLPFVTTPTGAQGIEGLENIVPVRADAHAIAEAILRLLGDDDAWVAQSKAQVEFARRRYSKDVMRASVLSALEGRDQARTSPDDTRAPEMIA